MRKGFRKVEFDIGIGLQDEIEELINSCVDPLYQRTIITITPLSQYKAVDILLKLGTQAFKQLEKEGGKNDSNKL